MAVTVAELRNIITVDSSAAETTIARFGQSLMGMSPIAVTAAAGIIGAFAGIAVAIGKAAFDAAESYDEAFDHMRVATGAVGEDAKKLQEVFRDVFTSIPTTTKNAAEAVGFLSARLKLTGTDLADLAKQEIELARITGTSLNEQLRVTARLFKDFDVKEPVKALDYLFKISQQTGTKITEVAASLVAYGAPLRGLGFDFKDATALIAKFQAEGVELGKVLPGLRQALSKLAKEGVADAGEALRKLVEGIKDAPTQTEAVGKAIEAFGRRAGPDLAEAIRQGRFSIDDLVKTVQDSGETIIKAADQTNDYGESWKTLSNKITDALQPLGESLRQFLGDMVKGLADLLKAYQDDWGGIKTAVDQAVKDISSFYNDNKVAIDGLAVAVEAALGIMAKVWAENTKSILDSIALITLGMRVAMGDWEGAWKQINEMGAREQEKTKKSVDDWIAYIKEKATAFATAFIGKMWDMYNSTVEVWGKIKDFAKQAWDAIGESIIGPIKRAYDFLKNLDWRTIFENLTLAAKLGLKPGSPPQAARWILEIGDAAKTAAATTSKAIPEFASSYKELSTVASKHLPAVAQEWLKLGETVLDVIGKIQKINLGGILGGGSASGSSTATKGGFLGALGKISEAVGGIASIFGGVDSIIKSIKSIFGIKSAFQKAMEAEQVAQARLQTQQMKLDIEKTAQEVIQAAVASFQKALEFFDKLDEFTPVRKAKFREFFGNLKRLMDYFLELAKSWAITSLAQAKAAAETIGPIAQAISALPAAFDAINGHFGVAQSAIDRFFNSFDQVMTAFFARADVWIEGQAKRAMKVANRLNPVITLISGFAGSLTAISDIKEPTDDMFAIFDRVIEKIVTHVDALSGKFDKSVLKVMANFAEKAGAALTLWTTAIQAIKETVDIKAISDADAENVTAGIELFIGKLGASLERMATTDLTRIVAFAQTILPIASALKAWADTSAAVRGYTAIAADAWDAIVEDFGKAIQLMGVLIGQATLFESMAITLEGILKSGSQHLLDGISAMTAGIVGTDSALQDTFGHLQGGEEVGGSVGASSVGGWSAQSASNVTHHTTINITQEAPPPEAMSSYENFSEWTRRWWREKQARALGMGEQIPAWTME